MAPQVTDLAQAWNTQEVYRPILAYHAVTDTLVRPAAPTMAIAGAAAVRWQDRGVSESAPLTGILQQLSVNRSCVGLHVVDYINHRWDIRDADHGHRP